MSLILEWSNGNQYIFSKLQSSLVLNRYIVNWTKVSVQMRRHVIFQSKCPPWVTVKHVAIPLSTSPCEKWIARAHYEEVRDGGFFLSRHLTAGYYRYCFFKVGLILSWSTMTMWLADILCANVFAHRFMTRNFTANILKIENSERLYIVISRTRGPHHRNHWCWPVFEGSVVFASRSL